MLLVKWKVRFAHDLPSIFWGGKVGREQEKGGGIDHELLATWHIN